MTLGLESSVKLYNFSLFSFAAKKQQKTQEENRTQGSRVAIDDHDDQNGKKS